MKNVTATLAEKTDVYSVVTDRIIAALDAGTIPWRKPWKGVEFDWPRNGGSGRRYNGINVLLLAMSGYDDCRWLTFNQAKNLGGSVRKGERGTTVIFWRFVTKRVFNEETGKWEERTTPFLRYYTVFNVQQCELPEGTKLAKLDTTAFEDGLTNEDKIDAAEAVVSGYPNAPTISYQKSDKAYYRPSTDTVVVPYIDQYGNVGEYYSTLFHELTHSTGHESRLNRRGSEEIRHFGDEAYSKEELVAEFGSAFLCATIGLDNTLDNSAAYIAGWSKVLKADNRLVVYAAAQAQHAADYILNKQSEIMEEQD